MVGDNLASAAVSRNLLRVRDVAILVLCPGGSEQNVRNRSQNSGERRNDKPRKLKDTIQDRSGCDDIAHKRTLFASRHQQCNRARTQARQGSVGAAGQDDWNSRADHDAGHLGAT